MEFTPEMIGYIKAIIKEDGIKESEMTKDIMRTVIVKAQNRMNKMIEDVVDGVSYRYKVAFKYTAMEIYKSIPIA